MPSYITQWNPLERLWKLLRRRATHKRLFDTKAQAGQDLIALAADDGRQAVRLVGQRAGEFGVRPNRVGMIGFSADGVVTSEGVFGSAQTRQDFAAITYGVGEIKEVPNPAPPLFLASAADDALAAGSSTVDSSGLVTSEDGRLNCWEGRGEPAKDAVDDHTLLAGISATRTVLTCAGELFAGAYFVFPASLIS